MLRSLYRGLHSRSLLFKDVQFGSLSENVLKDPVSLSEKEEDLDPTEKHAAKIADIYRPRPKDFLIKIQKCLDDQDLKTALDILEVQMKEECVKPEPEHFRLLIHSCGRRGYAKKSLELFKSYNSRGFSKSQGIYSDLFNSLYNCPYPQYALQRAHILRRSIQNINPNQILANNMIKTFGKCGDIETAFDIADASLCNVNTINHLLSACLSDKDSGFRHALVLWRRFVVNEKKRNVIPNAQSFSLLLRIAQECSIGKSEHKTDLLLEAMSVEQVQALADERKNSFPLSISNTQDKNLQLHFLQPHMDLKGVVGLSNQFNTPQDRFLAIGGMDGFLDVLNSSGIRPDVKICTQILRLLPGNSEKENKLLERMDAESIQPDIGFFNVLIKRRSYRRDFKSAREDVLNEIYKRGLEPEVRTYGILALTCSNSHLMHSLLNDLKNNGVRLNSEIIGALMTRPASGFHMKDMTYLLWLSRKIQLKISPQLLAKVEGFNLTFRKEILKYERGDSTYNTKIDFEIKNNFQGWKYFQEEYKTWLKSIYMENTDHEWKQYLTSAEEKDPSVLDKIQKIQK
nr:pentatricopeptide repeat-containing protein 1, mitochondrial-like [Lepeophtheirus salmonis]